MRKFFFVILLIGAAFAGGAAVNGPGLRWAQAMVLQRLGSGADDANDTNPSIGDNNSNPDDPSQPLVTETPGTGGGIPAAPIAPLVVATAKPAPAPQKEKEKESGPQSSAAPPELPAPSAQPAPESLKVALPTEPKTPEPLPPLEAPTASAAAPASAPQVTDNKAKGEDPAWGDAPGSAPAAAVPPKPFNDQARNPAERDAAVERVSAPADSPAAPSASASGDWSALRRKMRDLGVSRYGFEGEPGGRVRFSCVIPLAGHRAVGQQFEAEGDDEFQAAQVALRRVALWRATEDPGR